VPTVAEQGVPGVEAYIWQGLFGPKGMPDAIRNKLNTEVVRIMNLPDLKERVAKGGSELIAGSAEQLVKDINAEKAVWSKVIAEKNIKAE
jgi:tripartite-type tricarboxylate transporter receptor subunit TctC